MPGGNLVEKIKSTKNFSFDLGRRIAVAGREGLYLIGTVIAIDIKVKKGSRAGN